MSREAANRSDSVFYGLMLAICAISLAVLCMVNTASAAEGSDTFTTSTDASDLKIVQNVQQRDGQGNLISFEQGQALLPAYAPNGYSCSNGSDFWDSVNGAIDQVVSVSTNSDCLFRTVFAFECPHGLNVGTDPESDHIVLNVNAVDYEWTRIGETDIDGVRFSIWQAVYVGADGQEAARQAKVLTGGMSSPASLRQIALSGVVGSSENALFGPTYEVLVHTEAVSSGAEFGELTLDNPETEADEGNHPWKSVSLQYGADGAFESMTSSDLSFVLSKAAGSWVMNKTPLTQVSPADGAEDAA